MARGFDRLRASTNPTNKPMRKSNNAQKAKIHIARQELSLTDVEYEGLLAGFGVESSRDLSFSQADELLAELKRRGWTPKPAKRKNRSAGRDKGWGTNKYEYLRPRPGYMADPKQLRKIEAMWRDIANKPTDESLEKFVERLTKIKKLEWLHKKHARAVLTALKAMK